ncbi:MAG: 16S rRNA (guanine(527)-N(7))-methyltransferase RsmG [Pseudomonadota bacterium]
MTENEARDWAASRLDGPAVARLEQLAAIVIAESERQNLVSRSTLDSIWTRHIVDSLQLLPFAPEGNWIDIGTGAGFPGLAVAAAEPGRAIWLVEPRRLRADFLRTAVDTLGLSNVTVVTAKVEAVQQRARVISARAVARIGAVLASAAHCARDETIWLLPKGRAAREEVAEARQSWHGVFHVEQSITDPESSIVIARGVRPR